MSINRRVPSVNNRIRKTNCCNLKLVRSDRDQIKFGAHISFNKLRQRFSSFLLILLVMYHCYFISTVSYCRIITMITIFTVIIINVTVAVIVIIDGLKSFSF